MGSLAKECARLAAAHDFEWCEPAVQNCKRSAAQQYKSTLKSEFFLWTMYAITNRPKALEIVRLMIDRLDEVCPKLEVDPNDPQTFVDWYEKNKHDARSSANVAIGRGCHVLLGTRDGGMDIDSALAPNQFVNAWIAAMNDATHQVEREIETDLQGWLRDNVPQAAFTNNGEFS